MSNKEKNKSKDIDDHAVDETNHVLDVEEAFQENLKKNTKE
jgi:hypothetical protein